MQTRLLVPIFLGCLACIATVWHPIATSQPNEWMLKISNGEMVQAGVGITCWLSPFDKVVRFPATIHKVSFSAQQVSKEMQGVEVSGFIVWAVHRMGDGPFKAYRYLDGLTENGIQAANAQMRGMAESIVRHQVANEHLNVVIQNREMMRNKVRSQMLEVVQGWGMWLETVEVTDVRVLSNTVFKDLQAEYRLALHAKAESALQNTTASIKARQTQVDLEIAQAQDEAEAKLATDRLWQRVSQRQAEAKADLEFNKMALEKLQQEHQLELEQVKNTAAAKAMEQEEELKLQKLKAAADLAILKDRIEAESKMGPANMQKYVVDAAKEIYSSLPVNEVKLFHSGSGNSLESLLPGLSHAFEQLKESK